MPCFSKITFSNCIEKLYNFTVKSVSQKILIAIYLYIYSALKSFFFHQIAFIKHRRVSFLAIHKNKGQNSMI